MAKPHYFTVDGVHLNREANRWRVKAIIRTLAEADLGFCLNPEIMKDPNFSLPPQ